MSVLRPDRIHPNDLGISNFVSLYAQRYNFSAINLAKPGATNFSITLQIDRAIQDRADYVVVSATSPDRIDISLKEQFEIDLPMTVDNVNYDRYGVIAHHHIQQNNAFLISNTLNELIRHWDVYQLNEDHHTAIVCYVKFLYNYRLQLQKDGLIIEAALRRLDAAGIDFVFMPGLLNELDWSWLGQRLWTDPQPWDLPFGLMKQNTNHNPPEAHEMFLATLEKMTPHWQKIST